MLGKDALADMPDDFRRGLHDVKHDCVECANEIVFLFESLSRLLSLQCYGTLSK